jgi:hypothetical protein
MGHNHRLAQSPYFGHVRALAHDDAVNGLQLRPERLMRAFLPEGGFPEKYPRPVQMSIPGDAAQQGTLVGACRFDQQHYFRCSLHCRRAANALRKMVKNMRKLAFPFVPIYYTLSSMKATDIREYVIHTFTKVWLGLRLSTRPMAGVQLSQPLQ